MNSPHILIVVQNLPVPFDRRVWLECQALRAAGYAVSVVCIKGPGDPTVEDIEGVTLYKYRPYSGKGSTLGYICEYLHSFTLTALLVRRAAKKEPVHAFQACNPPDIFWPIGLFFRLTAGAPFIFDHHDLSPELYEARFPRGGRIAYLALRALEWCTFRSASHVISTNESYRAIAMGRGGKSRVDTSVVRTGPDASRLRATQPDPDLRQGRRYLAAYLGVMGPQDGVDILLRAASLIVNGWRRDDITFALMGAGDSFESLLRLRDDLGLREFVAFFGRVPDETVTRVLSTADIGLSPDPRNSLNELSTMNKTMEYMAFSLPIVAFDLRETRVSAGEAAAYAEADTIESYASTILDLLDDEERRNKMAVLARRKVEQELDWSYQRDAYLKIFDSLCKRK